MCNSLAHCFDVLFIFVCKVLRLLLHIYKTTIKTVLKVRCWHLSTQSSLRIQFDYICTIDNQNAIQWMTFEMGWFQKLVEIIGDI